MVWKMHVAARFVATVSLMAASCTAALAGTATKECSFGPTFFGLAGLALLVLACYIGDAISTYVRRLPGSRTEGPKQQ